MTAKSQQGSKRPDVNKFEYSDAPQRSPEWVEIRIGKPTASNLYRWLATSKRDGKPLQARKDYESELAFEAQFNRPFTRFVTDAMLRGQLMEGFLRSQHEIQSEITVKTVGCYHNNYFVASPDGEIGTDGIAEYKWVYDTAYSDVLTNGVPEAHMLQIQGQLWASGRKWCDYVVGNGNTKTFNIIRVERDEETISRISDSLKDGRIDTWIKTDGVFNFTDSLTNNKLTQGNGEFNVT